MKKFIRYFRLSLIFAGWTALYLWIISLIMSFFWRFEIFEIRYWKIISNFWQEGGVIDQPSEFMFLLMLTLIIPGWLFGFKIAKNLSYVKIIFFPVFWYHEYQNRKYAGAPTHIVLKNMGGNTKNKKCSPQEMLEEMISNRMPHAKQKKDLNSSKIRSNFEQKNRSFHEKMDSGDN